MSVSQNHISDHVSEAYTSFGYKPKKTTIVDAYIHNDEVCIVTLNNNKRQRRITSIWSISRKVLLQLPPEIQEIILTYRKDHIQSSSENKGVISEDKFNISNDILTYYYIYPDYRTVARSVKIENISKQLLRKLPSNIVEAINQHVK